MATEPKVTSVAMTAQNNESGLHMKLLAPSHPFYWSVQVYPLARKRYPSKSENFPSSNRHSNCQNCAGFASGKKPDTLMRKGFSVVFGWLRCRRSNCVEPFVETNCPSTSKTPNSPFGANDSKHFNQNVMPLRVDLGYKPK